MKGENHYNLTVKWTGNKGAGTPDYRAYDRSYSIAVEGKADILGSSDPAYLGDSTKHNPEELLVASLSSCHMLWYLHLCAEAKIVVIGYVDNATGIMDVNSTGGGHFTKVTLNPIVTVTNKSMIEKAKELHKKANELCFIANSVNFPVEHNATIRIGGS